MTAARFVSFVFAAWMLEPRSAADHLLPSPTQLSYNWIDPFTVNLTWSWKRPENLTQDCEVQFHIHPTDPKKSDTLTPHTHYSSDYLTEDGPSGRWEVSINAFSKCSGWLNSPPVSVNIFTPKPYMELVKDFKCFPVVEGLNCTWYPVNQLTDVTVSYRNIGEDKENHKGLQNCSQVYRVNEKNGCFMRGGVSVRVRVLVQSKTRMSSFLAQYATPATDLSIKQNGDTLTLSWTAPPVGPTCTWIYCIWYKECNEDKPQRCYDINVNQTVDIPYKTCCAYSFQYNLKTGRHCQEFVSNNSEWITYGKTKPCVQKVNVVVIIIPAILCLCVTLSCCCFSRHRDIFGLGVPDRVEIKKLVTRMIDKKIPKDSVPMQPQEHTESLSSFLNNKSDLQEN